MQYKHCYNCGLIHDVECCEYPSYSLKCYRCLVVSYDGSGHTPPCQPLNTVSAMRSNIFARCIVPLYKIRIEKNEVEAYFLSSATGQFVTLTEKRTLFSPSTDGMFTYHSGQRVNILDYNASSLIRHSVLIAIFDEGRWRVRFSVVPTATHGLLVFNARSTLRILNGRFILPPAFQTKSVFVLGLKTKKDIMKLDFRVYANETGNINYTTFNGYVASLTYQISDESFHVDEEINGELKTRKPKRQFDQCLYVNIPSKPQPVASFRSQRGQK